MKLPSFCYQKAFWILLPIILISTGSSVAAVSNEIASLDERVRENSIQLAANDVPSLKANLEKRFDRIDTSLASIIQQNNVLIKNNYEIKADTDAQLKLFCVVHKELCTS